MRHLVSAAALCLALSAIAPVAAAQDADAERLAQVRRVYIADLGGSEAAQQYRDALSAALRDAGFDVVERSADPDATLTGIVRQDRRGRRLVVLFRSVRLEGADGAILWIINVRPVGSMAHHARRVARALRSARKRAVWVVERRRAG